MIRVVSRCVCVGGGYFPLLHSYLIYSVKLTELPLVCVLLIIPAGFDTPLSLALPETFAHY